jgi:hypothetical protein
MRRSTISGSETRADFMGLEVLEFIVDLEQALGIDIPDQDIATISTPRQLVTYLCDRVVMSSPAGAGATSGWTRTEIEDVVEGFIAKTSTTRRFTLDTPFKEIFP